MKKQKAFRWILLLYSVLMLWLLFGQRWGSMNFENYAQQLQLNLNLQPFDTVRRYIWVLRHSTDPGLLRTAVVNLGGNVLMFVPLGFLMPGAWQRMRHCVWHFLTMVATIVSVELIQWVSLLGSCDVDDLILNLVGTSVGFWIWKWTSGGSRK